MNNEIKKWYSHFQNTLAFAKSSCIIYANPFFFFNDFARVKSSANEHNNAFYNASTHFSTLSIMINLFCH